MAELPSRRTTLLAADVISYGSQVANEELFDRIIARIHRYFLRVVQDHGEAEECLQETLVALEASLREKRYDATKSFNTWIWLKARTVYAQWCRNLEKRMDTLPKDLPERRSSEASTSIRTELSELLEEVARQAGPEAREAFVLYYEGGLTKGEISEVIGRDEKTVRKRIDEAHRIIHRLRRE